MIQTVKQVNAFNIFVLGVVVVPAVDVVDACVRFGLYGVVKDEIADGIGCGIFWLCLDGPVVRFAPPGLPRPRRS